MSGLSEGLVWIEWVALCVPPNDPLALAAAMSQALASDWHLEDLVG